MQYARKKGDLPDAINIANEVRDKVVYLNDNDINIKLAAVDAAIKVTQDEIDSLEATRQAKVR